jgi:hypothetical protein
VSDADTIKKFLPGLVMLDRLRRVALADDLVWLVPRALMPDGLTHVYGIPAILTDDAPLPMLAHMPLEGK